MTIQPITDAVYPKGAAAKQRRKPDDRRPVKVPRGTVAGALGSKAIDDLYRSLGFKRPDARRRK